MRTIRLLDTDILTPQHRYPVSLILNPETGEIVSGICGQKVTGRTREAVLGQLQTIADHVDAVDYRPFYEIQPDARTGSSCLLAVTALTSKAAHLPCDTARAIARFGLRHYNLPYATGLLLAPSSFQTYLRRDQTTLEVRDGVDQASRPPRQPSTPSSKHCLPRDANMRIDYAAVQLPSA